jgi:hypothetical protein
MKILVVSKANNFPFSLPDFIQIQFHTIDMQVDKAFCAMFIKLWPTSQFILIGDIFNINENILHYVTLFGSLKWLMFRVEQKCLKEVSSFHGYENLDCGLLGYDTV